MNSDAFFAIGSGHVVCQDYAATVSAEHVVLSDGCSRSPHTDFGARLLCRFAANHWPPLAPFLAEPLVDSLGLCRRCLDATILTAKVKSDSIEVLVAGDGVVVGRARQDKALSVWEYRFAQGAPRYPSYDLSPERRARYCQEFPRNNLLVESWINGQGALEEGESPQPSEACDPERLVFPLATYDLVLVFSDGISSFVQKTENGPVPVPLLDVVQEMLDIKGFAGEFLQRRARRFLQTAAAQGRHHTDDFSVAGIYVGDPP